MIVPMTACTLGLLLSSSGTNALSRAELAEQARLLGIGTEQLAVAGCSTSDVTLVLNAVEGKTADLEALHTLDQAVDDAITLVASAPAREDAGESGATSSAIQTLEAAQAAAAQARSQVLASVFASLDSAKAARLSSAIQNRSSGLPVVWTVLSWSAQDLVRLQSASLAAASAERKGTAIPSEAQNVLANAENAAEVSTAKTGIGNIASLGNAVTAWINQQGQ